MIKLSKQQSKILTILRQAGTLGMNSYEWRMQFIQLPVRIKELKEFGFIINSREKSNRSVDYVLLFEPSDVIEMYQEKPAPKVYKNSDYEFTKTTARLIENHEPKQGGLFA